MTVQDLINKLQQFDPTLPVVLSGYEGGVQLFTNIQKVTIAKDVNSPEDWWYGPHEIVWPELDDFAGYEKFQGIILT